MTRIIKNLRIPVQCGCGHTFHESFGWLKSCPELICPACRGLFSVNLDKIREAVDSVEESLYRLSVIDVSGEYFSTYSAFRKSRQPARAGSPSGTLQ